MPEEHRYNHSPAHHASTRPVDGLTVPQPWQAQAHHAVSQPPHPASHPQAHQPAPRPPAAHHEAHHHQVRAQRAPQLQPMPVIKMWSTRGIEYGMMVVSLWVAAIALAWIAIELINGANSFVTLVPSTSALIISVPILTFFFIRLKRAEIKHPLLRTDPSRRRWTQLTQFGAYLVIFASLIGLAYDLLMKYGADRALGRPTGKVILDFVVIMVISLAILIYYWLDEHRPIEG